MVLFNYATRELTAKIVYYGPGLCGKTTNLQYVHQNLPETVKGKMLSLATKTDRTLFFDFLPIDLGEIRGMKTRVQLYTVPGQVFYNETRKLVLKGADGIVFVADSQQQMASANVESFKNLEENLKAHGMKLAEMPHVIQFNKRDLPNLSAIEEMNATINRYNAPFYESVATTGIGVQDTLKAITKLVLVHLTKKYDPKAKAAERRAAPAPARAAAPAAAPARPPAAPRAAAPTPQPAAQGGGGAIPLSPVEGPAPAAQGAAAATVMEEAVPQFGEQEIDQLVGEVEQAEQPAAGPQVPAAAPTPVAPQPAAPPAGDAGFHSVSMGFEEPQAPAGPAIPSTDPAVHAAAGAPGQDDDAEFEVDLGFDPEWQQGEAAPQAPAAAPAPSADATIQIYNLGDADEVPQPDDSAVLLTDAAGDEDLFEDPNLEVTQLGHGTAREIVVPVMLGEGAQARKFKLSVTLKLDPLD